MLSAILATKLFIPPSPPKAVFRPRLIARLDEGLRRASSVTLVSAPAGFGKSTLISAWVSSSARPAAWLSLDEADNDPARFLTYLVAAIRTLAPNLGKEVLDALQSPPLPPAEAILTALLNEVTTLPDEFILALDDYHNIDSKTIDQALTFLLEHQPGQMHLVIATSEDPQLPLARVRAQGRLVELRVADLRFTSSEASEYLNQAMNQRLSDSDITALEDRTEGWVAGLQLAALSMQGQADIPGFIRTFAGDHRYIVDYLVEEVLRRQPEPVRSFLLQTAILDRLNGALCDAVTGQVGGKTRLETLQRGNFFLIPLDEKRHWYRYHHLFAEVLSLHLLEEQPEQVVILHRRASEWFEQNGAAGDAIRHALNGKDFERAADLIERTFPILSQSRQEMLLLDWLKALPETLIRCHPVLCNLYAGTLMQTGQLQEVETWLLAAERGLNQADPEPERQGSEPAKMVVVNQDEFRRLPASVAVHRAGQALLLNNVADTLEYARKALILAPEDDYLRRGGAAALLGLASWTTGDLDTAQRMYVEGMAWLRRAGYLSDFIGCAIALADIFIAQGRLRKAARTYEQALQLASENGTPTMRGTADMLVGLGSLQREQNDLDSARQYLQKCKEQGAHSELPQNRYRWRVAMARIREAEGDLNGALALLEEADRLYEGDFSPNVRPVAASRARVWASLGRFREALDWAEKQNLSCQNSVSYLREFEQITLAKILLACYRTDREVRFILEANELLARLLIAAEAGGRMGSLIEILIVQALALQAQGDLSAALLPLRRALTLAEPEGYVRIFLDEGEAMAQLLRDAAARGILPGYTAKLLEALNAELQDERSVRPANPAGSARVQISAGHPLVEPLSQRELEILRLFQTELSGPEIAQELVIALSTVRTQTKSIFSKLEVNNRRAAVKRASELGLL